MAKVSTSSLRMARALAQSMGSRPASSRLFSFSSPSSAPSVSSSSSSSCTSAAAAASRQPCSAARYFSSASALRSADQPPFDDKAGAAATSTPPPASPRPSSGNLMEGLADLLPSSRNAGDIGANKSTTSPSASSLTGLDDLDIMKNEVDQSSGEYHFAVWAHKHNTHICVSKPNNDVIMSISCGHLGFRSAQRSTYDAAYQLGAHVCDKLYQNNWHKVIKRMRVSLRGFGPGRDAVTKILLGMEGRALRPTITKVSDTTRLKFGGTRSPNPRRLG